MAVQVRNLALPALAGITEEIVMRKFLSAGALALAVTLYAPSESQAGCHERPVRAVLRNVAERWKQRLTRAGRVLVAVAERVTPTVAVQLEAGRPALLFSYRIAPAVCTGGRCND